MKAFRSNLKREKGSSAESPLRST